DGEVRLARWGLRAVRETDACSLDDDRLADCMYIEVEHKPAPRRDVEWFTAASVAVALSLLIVLALTDGWWWPLGWGVGAIGAIVLLAWHFREGAATVGGWLRDKTALILVLIIGFALPAASLLFATHLFDDLR